MPRITITVEGKVPQPYRFGLDREMITLGREDNNDIIVDCGSVSLHHAVMQRVHGGYELMDKGSTNGIRLNGEYRQVIDLKNGQSVLLGDVGFDFELSAEELAELAREDGSFSAPVDPASHLPPLPQEAPVSAPPLSPAPPVMPAWPDEPEEQMPEQASYQPGPVFSPGEPATRGGINLLVGILAAIAFIIGMEIHYRGEMGSSMIGRIHQKLMGKPVEAPAKQAPAALE